jgi:hypothetical protein
MGIYVEFHIILYSKYQKYIQFLCNSRKMPIKFFLNSPMPTSEPTVRLHVGDGVRVDSLSAKTTQRIHRLVEAGGVGDSCNIILRGILLYRNHFFVHEVY